MRPNVVNPTCDVVIPAHNAEKYIADAISSVFAQDFAVDQIIVVDDASTDGTAASAAATALMSSGRSGGTLPLAGKRS